MRSPRDAAVNPACQRSAPRASFPCLTTCQATARLHSKARPSHFPSTDTSYHIRSSVFATPSLGLAAPVESTSLHNTLARPPIDNVLFVRGISWLCRRADATSALVACCPEARHIEVAGFTTRNHHKKASNVEEQDHRGFALLVFASATTATAAVNRLYTLPMGGPDGLLISPAPRGVIPHYWSSEMWQSAEVAKQLQRREEQLLVHREHMKRVRLRKRDERVSLLQHTLSLLPLPGGLHASTAVQPLIMSVNAGDQRAGIEPRARHAGQSPAHMSSAVAAPLHTTYAATTMGEAGASEARNATADPITAPASPQHVAPEPNTLFIDWEAMPLTCQLGAEPLEATRFKSRPANAATAFHERSQMGRRVVRKRAQVESFLRILRQILTPLPAPSRAQACSHPSYQYHAVEFGCGSGSLLLPLAHLLPHIHFHGVDFKDSAVAILLSRAEQAGLSNVSASVGRIEEYSGVFDIGLALHACGSATDYAMLQAQHNRAAFIVSPCCVGKLKGSSGLQTSQADADDSSGSLSEAHNFSTDFNAQRYHEQAGGTSLFVRQASAQLDRLKHPRSRWMTDALPEPERGFLALARAADISHSNLHSHAQLALSAKTNIELDRIFSAVEDEYMAALLQLLQPEVQACKADVLVGLPLECVQGTARLAGNGRTFQWPWGDGVQRRIQAS